MEDIRQQQIDVLIDAVPYSEKIADAIEKVSSELLGVSLPETREAVDVIVEGINWLLEVYNGTKSIINPKKDMINEIKANEAVTKLSSALASGKDEEIGLALRDVGTFVKEFHDAGVPYVEY